MRDTRFLTQATTLTSLVPAAMTSLNSGIDPYRFQRQFDAFQTFVEEESGTRFVSFASNPYTEEQEGYKYRIYSAGRDALGLRAWKRSQIGSGEIARAVVKAIEIPESNLVPWQPRYGLTSRPHRALFEAEIDRARLPIIEGTFFELYRDEQEEKSFGELTAIFGRTYPLVAYLFFLKDRSRYIPDRTSVF